MLPCSSKASMTMETSQKWGIKRVDFLSIRRLLRCWLKLLNIAAVPCKERNRIEFSFSILCNVHAKQRLPTPEKMRQFSKKRQENTAAWPIALRQWGPIHRRHVVQSACVAAAEWCLSGGEWGKSTLCTYGWWPSHFTQCHLSLLSHASASQRSRWEIDVLIG